MQAILAVTVPFFALVLCGYLAARQHVLPESAIAGLNSFVLYFALPCMLFRMGAGIPVLQLVSPAVLALWWLASTLLVFVTLALSLNSRVGLKDAAFGALVAAFPNTGFMGLPLLVELLGHKAAGPAICTILFDIFITSSGCIALAQMHGEGGASAALRRVLRGTLLNPMPWSIALGLLFSGFELALPGPLNKVVAMLADAATPVALFTIGAVLWRSGQHASHKTAAVDFVPVALAKLLLHPLLVLLLGAALRQFGLPLSDFQLTVLVLVAALPSASNVAILAERYGADNGRIARIIMTSTAAAFATFTLAAWLLGAQPS